MFGLNSPLILSLFTNIVLLCIIILLIVIHRTDVRDLRDRLMSKDFHDYSIGKAIQTRRKEPLTDVQEAEQALNMTHEDRLQSDRLPVT